MINNNYSCVGQIFWNGKNAELALNKKLLTKVEKIVYGIVVDGKITYVGRTENLESRMPVHVSFINHFQKDKGLYSHLFKLFKNEYKKGDDTTVEIVILDDTAKTAWELSQKEKENIVEHDTLYPNGDNLVLGGGGCSKPLEFNLFESPGKIIQGNRKAFFTPGKENSYPLVKKDGRFFFDLPEEIGKESSLIYRLKKEGNVDEALYGKTEQSFKKRIRGYEQEINHSKKKYFSDSQENCDNGISIGIVTKVPKGQDPMKWEEYVVDQVKSLFPERVINNKTGGGNGSYVIKKLEYI